MTGDVAGALRAAYDAAGAYWATGPDRVYGMLAERLVARANVPLAGRLALDAGTGSGAAARALAARGARVVATDLASGMLAAGRDRPTAVVADVRRIPLRHGTVEVAAAAFVLNHLDDAAEGFRELARVTRVGGVVLASTFGVEAEHPVKAAVEDAVTRFGYRRPGWYAALKSGGMRAIETADRFLAAAMRAGLATVTVVEDVVDLADLPVADIVAWRLGMAATAPFVASLTPERRRQLADVAAVEIEGLPSVRLPMLVVRAVVC